MNYDVIIVKELSSDSVGKDYFISVGCPGFSSKERNIVTVHQGYTQLTKTKIPSIT
jgi:hypothetical protein